MKTTLCFTLTLITFVTLAFMPNSFAEESDVTPKQPQQQERPIVKVIYFYPSDRSPQTDIDGKLVSQLKKAQKLFADLMEAHGFERKTYQLEVDAKGDVIVHHRKGAHSDRYYRNNIFSLWYEFPEESDLSKDFYIVFFETDTQRDDLPSLCGLGFNSTEYKGGLLPSSGECFEGVFGVNVIAHELAHGFELAHDDRSDADAQRIYLDSIDKMITSYCAAEWLDAHPAFNTGSTTRNGNTSIEILEPELESSFNNIRFRFNVSDLDGLHQAKLLIPKSDGDLLLHGCKRLDGAVNSTIEIVAKRLSLDTPSATLRVLDIFGNYTQRTFTFRDPLPFAPPEVVSIVDPHLAAAIRSQIGQSITTYTILHLRELRAHKKRIKDLTGLEHAHNLRELHLAENTISDVSPLSKLTQLDKITFTDNDISDLRPLSKLTQLRDLKLGHNDISDIRPLEKLTNLENLSLNSNQLTDKRSLENLTNLKSLSLSDAEINDLSLLQNLMNLKSLFLNVNQISDLSPLQNLTNLESLFLNVNQISDLSPLQNLTKLRNLFLVRNQISDVSPLKGLVNLQRLHLQGNPIKDKKPLLELLLKNSDVKIYLEDGKEPLPVNLSRFRAEKTDIGVVLKWITESEVDNAGFYIYRSETKDGEFKVVNLTMVQGAGTTGERNEYTWTDTTAKPNTVYYYQIEDVSHAGVRVQLATVRLRGLVSARGKLTTRWADLKTQN